MYYIAGMVEQLCKYVENHLSEQFLLLCGCCGGCMCMHRCGYPDPCVEVRGHLCGVSSSFYLYMDSRDQSQMPHSLCGKPFYLYTEPTVLLVLNSHFQTVNFRWRCRSMVKILLYLSKGHGFINQWWTLWYVNYVSSGVLKVCGALNKDKLIKIRFSLKLIKKVFG